MTETPGPYMGEDETEIDDTEKVYFAVTVTKRRAEFLYKCLSIPLCPCGKRELAECQADPCDNMKKLTSNLQGLRLYKPPKFDGS